MKINKHYWYYVIWFFVGVIIIATHDKLPEEGYWQIAYMCLSAIPFWLSYDEYYKFRVEATK